MEYEDTPAGICIDSTVAGLADRNGVAHWGNMALERVRQFSAGRIVVRND
jgi:hypothetical protein